ncbi:hypothetical protein HPB50_024024 [Hyalomma asiaticum]|uniref:Uncharacterized protein n=1 Tax=Hyalomma asiaticum TaxID=266040 RepID=A0ACB7SXQ8_HYAAI|nr:hypothetical protein HPB50_024024 [Hyalomma asiaticum]
MQGRERWLWPKPKPETENATGGIKHKQLFAENEIEDVGFLAKARVRDGKEALPEAAVGTLRKHRVDDAGKARHRLIRRSFRATKTGVDALADAKRVSCLPPGWRGLAGVSGSLPMRLMFAEGPLCLRGDLLVAGVVKSAPARATTTCDRLLQATLSESRCVTRSSSTSLVLGTAKLVSEKRRRFLEASRAKPSRALNTSLLLPGPDVRANYVS